MKKRYIALLLCLLVAVAAVGFHASATEKPHDGNCDYHSPEALTDEYIAWENNGSLPTASGRYYLTGDVDSLETTHTITGDVDIILCLNGYTIHAPTNNRRTLRLQNGARLTLCDCTATDEGEAYVAGRLIPGGAEQGGAVGIYPRLGNDTRNTVFTLRDGIIDGSGITNSANGGAINLSQNDGSVGPYFAEFIMLGGQIKKCASKQNGGVAVLGSGGRFTMTGGEITGCNAGFGGGVIYSNNGHFVMNGGVIEGCSSPKGGVARIEGTATMTVTDGSILRCSSTGTGGAIHMQGGSFAMSGGEITGCTATGNGGAVCLDGYNAVIRLTGGSLTDNTAAYGGAVFFKNTDSTAELTVENMTITGNTASRGGGIEYFAAADVAMTVGGKTVIADNITRMGYPNNINLVSGSRKLQLGTALEADARIGISSRDLYALAYTVISTGVTQESAACFFSDEGHQMVCVDGALQQTVRSHAGTDYHGEESFTPWGSAYSQTFCLPTEGGRYQLTADIYMKGMTTISAPVDITLCLNGYHIYSDGENRILYLTGGAQLTICDCTACGEGEDYIAGKLIPGTQTGGAVGIYPSLGGDSRDTVLILRDGIIDGTGITSPNGGAGVNLSQKDGTTGENKAIFRMEGGQIINCTSGYRGGAVMLQSGGTWVLSGGTVRGCSAPAGGAAYVGNGTLEMSGGTITGCSSDNGGAVYASGESVTVFTGGVLEKNTAVNGGGVAAMKGSTVTLQGLVIRENTADYGGGIFAHGTVFALEGETQIANNIATKTGAGIVLSGGAELTVKGGAVTGNHAVQTGGDKAFGHGAGILVQSEGTKLIIQGGSIDGNIADGDGGGIYMSKKTQLILSGGSVSGNTSGQHGGGIYHLESTGSYSGGSVADNTAAQTGGGLLMGSSSKVTLSGSQIRGNRAETGGGVLVQGKSRFSMTGGSLSGNRAKYGGGLAAYSVDITVSGGVLGSNHASESGGAMLVNGGSLTMNGGTVKNNTATHGGGTVIQSKAVFTLDEGSFTGNTTVGDGAAIYISRNSGFTMNGGTVAGNTAEKSGGGIYHLQSTGNYNGGIIENNTAVQTGGGILIGSESTVTLSGSTVRGNRAETGGGMVIQGKSQFTMSGGTVCGNSASINGGGIYGWKVDYSVGKDATVCHNTAGEVGGGMVCYSGKLVVEGTVSHNNALHAGGISSLGLDATLELNGATVCNNKVHGDGAGVYIGASAQINMNGGAICDNLAGNDGGGIYQLSSIGVYKNAQINGNTALRNGGGLFILNNTTVNLTDTTFESNTAKRGGGVYITENTVLRLNSCAMRYNTARITGSAVYTLGNTALNSAVLTGNDAEQGYTVHSLGVTKLTGKTVFEENTGVLPGLFPAADSKTTVADLDAQAHILVQTGGEQVTDVLGGSYDYTETDSGWLVTAGEASVQEEVPTQPVEEPQPEEENNLLLPVILLVLAAAMAALTVVLLCKWRKDGKA